MNQNKYRHVIFSLAANGLLLGGMFLLLKGMPQTAYAAPNNLFVSPTGSGDYSQATPCNLLTALSTATDGDTIYLADGTYTGSGGGISIYFSDAITLSNNIISGNTANARGGGVFLYTNDATLNGNIILDNTANGASWGSGGLFLEYSAPTLTNNIIINNQLGVQIINKITSLY